LKLVGERFCCFARDLSLCSSLSRNGGGAGSRLFARACFFFRARKKK